MSKEMDATTGDLYGSLNEAAEAGVAPENMVKLVGDEKAIRSISQAVKAQRRAKNKQAKESRRRNR